ncbi:serine/threonine-protein kinase Nek4 isoform X2 [Antennarius striatus]|uniref:serine/threonine-protein kinase Nek4 isoform X2 n=1 Tax=Antennarius striatus TaxID=241820 RepID=UPI0035B35FF8
MSNYIFIRVVGKGSYGEVNLVKHKTDQKQYVIKKLNLITSSKRERRSAEQEAQLLSQLRHPNIVTYRESWEGDDCQLYIVMGFCEGGDLYHRLKQQKGELLPEKQVVEWFVQIAMALQYLHERNILHRDLKTQNIFLTKKNIIKVGDLGIARVLESRNDMASTLIGTPYYMSPELFSNKPYNHKSDVWALGCCVYEMSTLKHAFNAKDMNSLVYRIVEGKLPQMPSRYDPQLGDIIKSMLCKRPEDRPDVKLILRQPYIKRQIAMFLEASKEITAKSRMKAVGGSGNCVANIVSSVASAQPKPERVQALARVKRKEEVSQKHEVQNGANDSNLAQKPSPSKFVSPDALKASVSSLATVSNIDIELQRDEDPVMRRQVQGPQLAVVHHRGGNEPVSHSVDKDGKGGGKPDFSPAPSPPKPPLKSVSGGGSGGEDERRATNELLDIPLQATPNPGETFIVCGEKQLSDVDNKDDTMELLKEAGMQSPMLEMDREAISSIAVRKSAEKLSAEDIDDIVEINLDDKNDTNDPPKRAPTQLHTSDIQENLESTEKLLEPLSQAAELFQERSALPANVGTPYQTPFSSETSSSRRDRGMNIMQTNEDQDKSNLAVPRPLPPHPIKSAATERRKQTRRNTERKKAAAAATSTSVSSYKDGFLPLPLERPLSARERRRLRQSQEISDIGVVRRASCDVTSVKDEHHKAPVTRSMSETATEADNKEKTSNQRSDEDECSSSTSSTDRSEGDCGERLHIWSSQDEESYRTPEDRCGERSGGQNAGQSPGNHGGGG